MLRAEPRPSAPPHVTVVIPALNEADNLPHVLPYIPLCVDEIILVDGRSTDRTTDVYTFPYKPTSNRPFPGSS
jgi:glycosyltransferase involved in cell wall biosynthesis